MRLPVLVLGVMIAACGGKDQQPRTPVIPEWSCFGGASCPNADSVRTVYDAWGSYLLCEWGCATYQGHTGHVVATRWPACSASSTESWSSQTCAIPGTCSGMEAGYACNAGSPYCTDTFEADLPDGVRCSRQCAYVSCGLGSSTATVTTDVTVFCAGSVTVDSPGACG